MEENPIIYYVNGEIQKTDEHKLKVETILSNAGFKPVTDYELERNDGHKIFKDLNEEIPIHNDEKFTALFTGTTPVSERG